MVAALSPDIELVGATAVNGNTGVDDTTENTLRVFDLIGRPDIPVFRGMATPMLRPQGDRGMAAVIHRNLLDLPAAKTKARAEHAVDWLRDTYMTSEGEITLVAVGPLTNVAMALLMEPRMAERIPEIVIMGGAHESREPDGVGRVQLLGGSRSCTHRRRVRPPHPHGPPRCDTSRPGFAPRLRAPSSARDRGGEHVGGDRRAADPRLQRDAADGRRVRRSCARRPGRVRGHRTWRCSRPGTSAWKSKRHRSWPRDARSAMSAPCQTGARTSSSPSTPTGRGSWRCSSRSSVGRFPILACAVAFQPGALR